MTYPMLINGATHVFADEDEIASRAQHLERSANRGYREHMRAMADLGWIIIQHRAQRRPDQELSKLYIYKDLGVHPKRGDRAEGIARNCIDPKTGTFSVDRYNAWKREAIRLKAEKRRQRLGLTSEPEPDLTDIDSFDDPSPHAMMVAMGIRNDGYERRPAKPAPNTPDQVGFARTVQINHNRGDEPGEAVFDTGGTSMAALLARTQAQYAAPAGPGLRIAGKAGASGAQMELRLAEAGRRIADAAAGLERAVQDGRVSIDQAAQMQERLDAMLDELGAMGGA